MHALTEVDGKIHQFPMTAQTKFADLEVQIYNHFKGGPLQRIDVWMQWDAEPEEYNPLDFLWHQVVGGVTPYPKSPKENP